MTEPVLYTCEFIGLDVCNELTIAKSEIERLKAEVVRLSTVDWQSAYADEMHKNQDLQAQVGELKDQIESLEMQLREALNEVRE